MASLFINDQNMYKNRTAFYKAQCEHTVYLMEQAAKRQLLLDRTLTDVDLHQFQSICEGLSIAPLDTTFETRKRTLHAKASDGELVDVSKQCAVLKAKLAKKWLMTEYCPSKPLLSPMDETEVKMLVSKLLPSDAKLLSGGYAPRGCVEWKGMMNNKKPMLERRRTKVERKEKRKRIVGSAAEVIYNYFREPLRQRQRLSRTCDNIRCVNPFHFE